MQIHEVTDAAFSEYGRIMTEYKLDSLLEKMNDFPVPEEGFLYVASEKELEETTSGREIRKKSFGGMPVQIGYCNVRNRKVEAVEYHRSSEIDIAVDDLILVLGKRQDIEEDMSYDSAKLEAFRVPAGTAVELYATTLHYAPCSVDEKGAKCVIVLPKGTNEKLDFEPDNEGENKILRDVNKWLLVCETVSLE